MKLRYVICWNAFVLLGCTYMVCEKGYSVWWWLLAAFLCPNLFSWTCILELLMELVLNTKTDADW